MCLEHEHEGKMVFRGEDLNLRLYKYRSNVHRKDSHYHVILSFNYARSCIFVR